jgi:4-hydroxy-tetrahydrodipicolinate synthase
MEYAKADSKRVARESFHGLWAAITTPFDTVGAIDEAGLLRDIDRLTGPLGIDGIFCTGVMGEFWALSVAERRRSVELIVEACGGRVPVIAHTGHHSAQETIQLTRHATEAGADFAVVINPYYPAAADVALYNWFREVLDSVDIGVWLFDTNYSGVALSSDLINRLADVENVCGIKVGHDHVRYLEVLDLVGDRILVCEPNESTWLENMRDHDQKVYMSAAAPFLYQTPEWQPMREYTTLALAGEFEKAAAVSATLDPVRALATKWLHGRWNRDRVHPVPYIKAWAGHLGMSGGDVRVPLSPVTSAERDAMATELEAVGLISA